jgi:hypothetical protein
MLAFGISGVESSASATGINMGRDRQTLIQVFVIGSYCWNLT